MRPSDESSCRAFRPLMNEVPGRSDSPERRGFAEKRVVREPASRTTEERLAEGKGRAGDEVWGRAWHPNLENSHCELCQRCSGAKGAGNLDLVRNEELCRQRPRADAEAAQDLRGMIRCRLD